MDVGRINAGAQASVAAQRGIPDRRAAARPDDAGGVSSVAIGALAGGGALTIGGLALRAAGHGRLGLGMAAIGGALLGVTLLSACGSLGVSGPPVPGDEGDVDGSVFTVPGSIRDLPTVDSTSPAPDGWRPSSGTRDAREGVVQISHSRGTGSGWVVAPGQVITNYHVAQGHRSLNIIDHEGERHAGTVLRLDLAHDLALVSAPTLDDTPLPMDDTVTEIETGETTGYPDGRFSNDAALAVSNIDITDGGRRRSALYLSGTSAPGVSGGAVINGAGEVMGTSFAVGSFPGDEGEDDVSFVLAIPNDQVRGFLDAHAASSAG